MWALACLLFTLASGDAVLPLFACWYPSFPNQTATRQTNLVFSYNNTGQNDTLLPLGPGSNQFTPAPMDGFQDDVLKVGYHPFVLALPLQPNDTQLVQWVLGNETLQVTPTQWTDATLLCGQAYGGACPNWIDGFCQDASYCNGAESCFTVSMFGAQSTRTMGVCVPPQSGVQCQAPQRCSEQALGCVVPPTEPPSQPPTASPDVWPLFFCWFLSEEPLLGDVVNLALGYNSTAAVPLARPVTPDAVLGDACNNVAPPAYNGNQPTLFQAGVDPLAFTIKDVAGVLAQPGGQIVWALTRQTLIVTAATLTPQRECSFVTQPTDPLDEPVVDETVQCTTGNTTCNDYDTFCHGPTQCNTTSQQCVPVDPDYNPCLGLQTQVAQGAPVTLECVEHLQLCVAYVNCSIDADCQDGVFCNGPEYCSNGTCYGQPNWTIVKQCGTANAYCEEGEGGDGRCVATNQVVSQRAVTGIVAGAALVVVILIIAGYYFFHSSRGSRPKS